MLSPKSLPVSEDLEAMLPTATLTANVENDENGTRIVLGLNWDRPGKPQPVTLVGWLDPTPGTPTSGTPQLLRTPNVWHPNG